MSPLTSRVGEPAGLASDAPSRYGERASWLNGRLGSVGLPVVLALTVLLGASLSPRFLTVSNFLNVLNAVAVVGLIALPMTYVLIVRGLADLSVPAAMATGGILTLSLQSTLGTTLALAVGVSAAGMAGLVSGLLIAHVRANPIIITLGVNTLLLGLAQAAVGGAIVYASDPRVTEILRGRLLGVPTLIVIFACAAIAAHLLLSRSIVGRWMYAVGGNDKAAEAAAVPVKRVRASAFILTAIMGGLGGALLALHLGQVRPGIGTNYEFDAITAVVVGGTSLLGGAGSIPRTVAGLLLVQTVTNIMSLQGVPTPAQGLAKGAIIVAAASIDVMLRRRGRR